MKKRCNGIDGVVRSSNVFAALMTHLKKKILLNNEILSCLYVCCVNLYAFIPIYIDVGFEIIIIEASEPKFDMTPLTYQIIYP